MEELEEDTVKGLKFRAEVEQVRSAGGNLPGGEVTPEEAHMLVTGHYPDQGHPDRGNPVVVELNTLAGLLTVGRSVFVVTESPIPGGWELCAPWLRRPVYLSDETATQLVTDHATAEGKLPGGMWLEDSERLEDDFEGLEEYVEE